MKWPFAGGRPFARGFAAGSGLVLVVVAVTLWTPIPDLLAGPLLESDTAGPADAIVVLGAAVHEDCEPNTSAFRRTMLAAKLYRKGRGPLMAFTGGLTGSGGPCPSAEVMAALARDLGVPEDRILVENASANTWENASRTAPLLRSKGVATILLVTDCLHMRRAEGCFRKMGFSVERASVPSVEAYDNNAAMLRNAIHEYLGLVYYRLNGRLGG
jgi:uncharacterized SAM-binding protein YcdF (DUF218 family)